MSRLKSKNWKSSNIQWYFVKTDHCLNYSVIQFEVGSISLNVVVPKVFSYKMPNNALSWKMHVKIFVILLVYLVELYAFHYTLKTNVFNKTMLSTDQNKTFDDEVHAWLCGLFLFLVVVVVVAYTFDKQMKIPLLIFFKIVKHRQYVLFRKWFLL